MEETKNNGAQESANEGLEAVTSFFKQDFLKMLMLFLKEPVSGTYSLFEDKKDKLFPSIILIGVTVLLYITLPFILGFGKYIGFGGALKMGLFPLFFMLFVTLITFGLKFISDKPDIKAELFTGALQALPFLFLFVIIVILRIFGENVGASLMSGNVMGAGIVFSIIMLFLILMMINIVMQSLKASKAKDALAWYLSPVVVLLSFYLTAKLAGAMF